jgi:segregation and condensation protein B
MLRGSTHGRTLAECLAAVRAGTHPDAPFASERRRRPPIGPALAAVGPGEPLPSPAAGGHLRSDELARLEAALFIAREPLTTRRLAKLARLPDGTRARALLRELRGLQEASGSAMRVEQIAGGFQLLSRAAFGPWIRRLADHPSPGKLSPAGLETLAIVAYRQPVTRAEIEAIRGVGSEEMLRQLLERDLVGVGGRAEDLGRPNVYVTTRRFLAAFGLARIEDLPPLESLFPAAAGQPPESAGESGSGLGGAGPPEA